MIWNKKNFKKLKNCEELEELDQTLNCELFSNAAIGLTLEVLNIYLRLSKFAPATRLYISDLNKIL